MDRQTDVWGSRVPPPSSALRVHRCAGSLWPAPSYPSSPDWGWAVSPVPVVSAPFPSPGGPGMSWGGRTGTPGSEDFISVAAGARSAHAQRCPRVKDRGQRRNLCIQVLPRVSPCLNARQGSATRSRCDRGSPNHCCGPGPCLVWKVSTSLLLTQLLFLSKPSLWLGCFCCSHSPLQREPLPPLNTHFTWAADSPRLRQNQPELIEHLLCSSKATSIPPAEPSPWTSSCSHPFCSLSPSVTFSLPQG